MIHLTAGGEAGRHLAAIVAPLLIHDLPVTVWWPGEPPFGTRPARDLLAIADRLVVDGSTWSGDGLARLREMAELLETAAHRRSATSRCVRQSRWREAIASIFDDPEFLPYLRSLRRIAVTYATHDETGAPGSTNLVKPVYHVAWLASRLGLRVVKPLAPVDAGAAGAGARSAVADRARNAGPGRGLAATLSDGRADVAVVVRPVVSPMPAGTTLRVELLAERRGSELRADVTAEAETVHVRVWQDGVEALDRHFQAPRRTDVDLLAEAIEAGGRDPVASGALRAGRGTHRAAMTRPWERPVAEPSAGATIVGRRGPAPSRRSRRPTRIADGARGRRGRGARRADWATTGGSSAVGDLPAPCRARPLRDAVAWQRRPRLVGRRPLRPARPPALERQAVRRHPRGDRARGGGHGRARLAGRAPVPLDQIHPFPTGEAIGDGRDAGVVRRRPGRRAADGRAGGGRRTAGRSSTSCSSGSGPTGTSCRCSRARRRSTQPTLGAGHPGADPHRAARRARDAATRRSSAAARQVAGGRHRRGQGRRSSAEILGPERDPRRLAGAARRREPARPGSSTRPRLRACRRALTRRDRPGPDPQLVRSADGTSDRGVPQRATGRRSCSSTARPPTTRRSGSSGRCSARTARVHAIDRRGRGASGDTRALRDRARVRGRRRGRRRARRRDRRARSTSSGTRTAAGSALGRARC